MDYESLSLLAAALIVWIALVHILMAFGVRRGELVWSGRYPRLLTPDLRRRSLLWAILMLFSAWVIGAFGGAIDVSPVPDRWLRSAGWTVTVFLGAYAIYSLFRGSKWERFLFLPMTLFAAGLAGWLTFG